MCCGEDSTFWQPWLRDCDSQPVYIICVLPRGDEANKLRAQMRRGLSKGLNVKVRVLSLYCFCHRVLFWSPARILSCQYTLLGQLVHRKPTFQEALVRQQKAESKAQEEEELFKKRLQKKKAVPLTSGQQRRGSDPAPAAAGRTGRRPSNAMDQHTSTASPDAISTDEVDVHYYHGLEANTQVRTSTYCTLALPLQEA